MADIEPVDANKPMPVITDVSLRAVRERNPDDATDHENIDQQTSNETDASRRNNRSKKGHYGNYASALRKTDPQSDLRRRKEQYAAALEGARIDEDDINDFYPNTGINPDEPDVMSTIPLDRIKEQYLSTAKEEGKVIEPTEDRPTPQQLGQASWPPKPGSTVAPKVIDITDCNDKPQRDGVDGGNTEAVEILKKRWQNIPEEYRQKPLGVNKPNIGIKADNKWITQFKPVIDEGESPEDPEWLKTVRHRRWMSTVKARFPEDEKEKISFEKRSTTPRKIKKPNPYTLMRSTCDIDNEFDDVMRRRRKHSDNYEEGSYLTRSQSSFVKSASSFRSDGTADYTDGGKSVSLTKTPVQGPIKEYLKNLSLERSRGSMLKWAFSADVVDEPYRYDLPKPIDLLIMDELERENEWKYEQARRRFNDDGVEGLSIHSSSHASFMSEDDYNEPDGAHRLLDETAGFIPKLSDVQEKLKENISSKPLLKTNPIDEESKFMPKIDDTKEKFIEADDNSLNKKPFTYEGEESAFEGIEDVKKKLPNPADDQPKDLFMPTTVLKEDKDFKKIMKERKTAADEASVDRAESAAQDIQTLASDINKAFSEERKDEQPVATK